MRSSVNGRETRGGGVYRCDRLPETTTTDGRAGQTACEVVVAVLHAMARRAGVLVDDPDHGACGLCCSWRRSPRRRAAYPDSEQRRHYRAQEVGYPIVRGALREAGGSATVVNGASSSSLGHAPVRTRQCHYSLIARGRRSVLRSRGGGASDHDRVHAGWAARLGLVRRHPPRVPGVESDASSNTRSKLRRAPRNCAVRRMSCDELATAGYEVYRRAFDRYRRHAGRNRPSRPTCGRQGFDDVIQHWAVTCDGELAGYSTNYVFGRRRPRTRR